MTDDTTTSNPFPPAAPSAPPTQPGPLSATPRPPAWPTVLGVISIVFGAGGLFFGLLSMLMPIVLKAAGAAQAGVSLAAEQLQPWTLALHFASFCLAGLLLTAGILIVRRRPAAPTLTFVWAVLRMILVVFAATMAYSAQKAQFAAMSGQPGSPPPSVSAVIAIGTAIFALLWGWAWPVFLLIWFSRSKVKAHVATWS
jgi:hypothetical protein